MRRLKLFVINYLTKHLIRAITEEDILVISGKDWLYKNRKLTAEEILLLKEEAQSFNTSTLYRLMYNELRFQAMKQMADDAVNIDDIIFGKAMLYSISLEKKFIRNIIKQ